MDGSAAFFYNVSTQRADRSKRPSAHTNISVRSQAHWPIKPTFKSSKTHTKSASISRVRKSLSSTTTSTITSTQEGTGTKSLSLSETSSENRMPSNTQLAETLLFGTTSSLSQNNPESSISSGAQINTTTTRTRQLSPTPPTPPTTTTGTYNNSNSATDRKHAPTAERESISSMSGTGSSSLTAITTGERSPSSLETIPTSFTRRHGRRYLRDTTLCYPLPCDITELHRQTLRTMLMCKVFGGPICSPKYKTEPPKNVLDFSCGTGYWSTMCHQHYTKLGFPPIAFTGLDIAPLAPNMNKEDGMNWTFVQGDFRKQLPFPDDTFDFVFSKDQATAIPLTPIKQFITEELIRVTAPGGVLEIWDGDTTVRMLLPHTPASKANAENEDQDEVQELANTTGTYMVTTQTPFAAPQNQYLMDYNNWVSKVCDQKNVTPLPCTVIRSEVLQEAEVLTDMGFRRLAIPLSEVRWEREGVGGYVKLGPDGQARISAKGKAKEEDKKVLTAGQAALRRTALQTVVQMIESLEPLLREASGKGQDEWDRWWGSMMSDLMKNNGTSWGECLEIGAWWATKR